MALECFASAVTSDYGTKHAIIRAAAAAAAAVQLRKDSHSRSRLFGPLCLAYINTLSRPAALAAVAGG